MPEVSARRLSAPRLAGRATDDQLLIGLLHAAGGVLLREVDLRRTSGDEQPQRNGTTGEPGTDHRNIALTSPRTAGAGGKSGVGQQGLPVGAAVIISSPRGSPRCLLLQVDNPAHFGLRSSDSIHTVGVDGVDRRRTLTDPVAVSLIQVL